MHEIAATHSSIHPVNTLKTTNSYTNVRNERMAGFVASYSDNAPVQGDSGDKVLIEEGHSFGFFDLIDMINPLQHLPLVNIAYRKITGDEIKPISSIIGGAIYGGPVGAASNMLGNLVEEGTGKSPIETVLSLGDDRRDDISAYKNLPPELLTFAEIPSVNDQNYNYNT